jgi:hypothetical protein
MERKADYDQQAPGRLFDLSHDEDRQHEPDHAAAQDKALDRVVAALNESHARRGFLSDEFSVQ